MNTNQPTTEEALVRELHDAARTTAAIVAARWEGKHKLAGQMLATMNTDQLRSAVWSMSGMLESALEVPPGLDKGLFLDLMVMTINKSEDEQRNDQQEGTSNE